MQFQNLTVLGFWTALAGDLGWTGGRCPLASLPSLAARSALQPRGPGPEEEWAPEEHSLGSPKWALSVLKDTRSCHLRVSLCSRQAHNPLLEGSPPSLSRRDVVASANTATATLGLQPGPRRPRGRSWSRGAGLRRAPQTGSPGSGLSVRQVQARSAPRARSQAERDGVSSRRGAASLPSRAAMPAAPRPEARAWTPLRRKAPRPPACTVRLVLQVPADARSHPACNSPLGCAPDSPPRPRLTCEQQTA